MLSSKNILADVVMTYIAPYLKLSEYEQFRAVNKWFHNKLPSISDIFKPAELFVLAGYEGHIGLGKLALQSRKRIPKYNMRVFYQHGWEMALDWAAVNGHRSWIEWFINHINYDMDQVEENALLFAIRGACHAGRRDIATWLMDMDKNMTDSWDLNWAVSGGKTSGDDSTLAWTISQRIERNKSNPMPQWVISIGRKYGFSYA